MMRLACLAALAAAFLLAPAQAAAPTPSDASLAQAQIRSIADRLHPVRGDIRIAEASATLHLGDDYYFLPANEAQLVLTEAWGNPPETVRNVLGMVFPADRTFADDTWGAVITYQATGYVSDSDAGAMDYAELLTTLRGDEQAVNAERARRGYPATHLVGWAQQPSYDARAHSLIWALDIQFAGQTDNSLNYDVRLLGRNGVLSLNMVTVMSKLEETRAAAQRFASAAEFTSGARYADYREGDRVAEYGIAGLIAASVGATVAKKAGLLALILAFGKKIIIFLIAGVAIAWRWLRGLFGRREEETDASYYDYYEEAPAPDYAADGPPSDAIAHEASATDAPPDR